MTSAENVIIITTVTTGIVSCINAVAAGWGRREVRQKAEEVKQVAQTVHNDIVNKVIETKEKLAEVANGNNLSELSKRIDVLSIQVGHIEEWMIAERTARTRSSDVSH